MRAVWSWRPHPQASTTRGVGWRAEHAAKDEDARPRPPPGRRPTRRAPACLAVRPAGGRRHEPETPGRPRAARSSPLARRPGSTSVGTTPSTTHTATSSPTARRIVTGTSTASSAASRARPAQEADADRLDEGDHGQPGGERHGGHGQGYGDVAGGVPRGGAVQQALEQEPFADEAVQGWQGGRWPRRRRGRARRSGACVAAARRAGRGRDGRSPPGRTPPTRRAPL